MHEAHLGQMQDLLVRGQPHQLVGGEHPLLPGRVVRRPVGLVRGEPQSAIDAEFLAHRLRDTLRLLEVRELQPLLDRAVLFQEGGFLLAIFAHHVLARLGDEVGARAKGPLDGHPVERVFQRRVGELVEEIVGPPRASAQLRTHQRQEL